jgi:hypothetical protein
VKVFGDKKHRGEVHNVEGDGNEDK